MNRQENLPIKHMPKRKHYGLLSFIIVFFIVGIPLIINELYKIGNGYITLWDASDVLSYYAEILSGVIAIGTLIVTIYYTRKDTERQIKASQAQYNVPFFLIESVGQSKNSVCFTNTNTHSSWNSNIYITTDPNEQQQIEICLVNIGEGIAIAPRYIINILSDIPYITEKYVDKLKQYKLQYNLHQVLFNRFGPKLFPQKDETFYAEIVLFYQNTSGILYSQIISLKHICNIHNNTVSLSINEISPQRLI